MNIRQLEIGKDGMQREHILISEYIRFYETISNTPNYEHLKGYKSPQIARKLNTRGLPAWQPIHNAKIRSKYIPEMNEVLDGMIIERGYGYFYTENPYIIQQYLNDENKKQRAIWKKRNGMLHKKINKLLGQQELEIE